MMSFYLPFFSVLFFIFFKNYDSVHAKLNSKVQGMELQEKEAQKE